MHYIVLFYQQPDEGSSDVYFYTLICAKQSKMHTEWTAQIPQTKRYHKTYIRVKLIGCFHRPISSLLLSVCASPTPACAISRAVTKARCMPASNKHKCIRFPAGFGKIVFTTSHGSHGVAASSTAPAHELRLAVQVCARVRAYARRCQR